MTTTQQPEAPRLADAFDIPLPPEWEEMKAASAELRRLHARVQELENITEAAKRGFSAITKRHDDWKWRALEAESQLEAIGAGGVESLRGAKSLTDEEIEDFAKPFIRSLGGDHWYSGEDGIPDLGQIEEFARAIEKHHGIGA